MWKRLAEVHRRAVRGPTMVAGSMVAVALCAAACGSAPGASVANLGSSSTTVPTHSAGPGQGGQSQDGGSGGHGVIGMGGVTVKFARCMRTHGVPNFPDPNSQGGVTLKGVDPQSTAFRSANSACAKYAPNGGKPPSAAQTQQMLQRALKFSQCMRAHGIADFPDPKTGPGGGIRISLHGGSGNDLNPNNPTFQAAQKACQSLMPKPQGNGPSSKQAG